MPHPASEVPSVEVPVSAATENTYKNQDGNDDFSPRDRLHTFHCFGTIHSRAMIPDILQNFQEIFPFPKYAKPRLEGGKAFFSVSGISDIEKLKYLRFERIFYQLRNEILDGSEEGVVYKLGNGEESVEDVEKKCEEEWEDFHHVDSKGAFNFKNQIQELCAISKELRQKHNRTSAKNELRKRNESIPSIDWNVKVNHSGSTVKKCGHFFSSKVMKKGIWRAIHANDENDEKMGEKIANSDAPETNNAENDAEENNSQTFNIEVWASDWSLLKDEKGNPIYFIPPIRLKRDEDKMREDLLQKCTISSVSGILLYEREASRGEIQVRGLHPSVCWAMAKCLGLESLEGSRGGTPGGRLASLTRDKMFTILDPCCGNGICLVEAANLAKRLREQGRLPSKAYCIGIEQNLETFEKCLKEQKVLEDRSQYLIINGDSGDLGTWDRGIWISDREMASSDDDTESSEDSDTPSSCRYIDAVISDLPFGKQHGSVEENKTLYKQILLNSLTCLKVGGRAVFLTNKENRGNMEAAIEFVRGEGCDYEFLLIAQKQFKLAFKMKCEIWVLEKRKRSSDLEGTSGDISDVLAKQIDDLFEGDSWSKQYNRERDVMKWALE